MFVIKEAKGTTSWKYVLEDLNHDKIARTFYEQKTLEDKLISVQSREKTQ